MKFIFRFRFHNVESSANKEHSKNVTRNMIVKSVFIFIPSIVKLSKPLTFNLYRFSISVFNLSNNKKKQIDYFSLHIYLFTKENLFFNNIIVKIIINVLINKYK